MTFGITELPIDGETMTYGIEDLPADGKAMTFDFNIPSS